MGNDAAFAQSFHVPPATERAEVSRVTAIETVPVAHTAPMSSGALRSVRSTRRSKTDQRITKNQGLHDVGVEMGA